MKFMECAVRDVIYGTNVRIVKPVNIYECELRDNVFVGPFVEIQKGCVIGSGAIILSPYICSGAVIGAGSVVVKPIENKGIYAGNPARLLRIL
ncbi:TPA: N-acetyltransferase, partial [Escherichia coli]|nr:N-acetyltransferase [Escherichia coli]